MRQTFEERFYNRIKITESGCHEWTGAIDACGYGRIAVDRINTLTHRVAYELAFGPILKGLHVLHSCDNPPCCNPEHLWLGTHAENMADKIAKGRDPNQKKTHCAAGHEFNENNTYKPPNSQQRACRKCNRTAVDRYKSRFTGAV